MEDCKVKLSIRGGSGLSIQDYHYCPQLLKHKINKVFFKLTPTYYVTGRIIHENFNKIICNEKPMPQERIKEIFESGEIVSSKTSDVTTFTPDSKPIIYIPKILSEFKYMLGINSFGEILESEEYYEGFLVDPETMEENKDLKDNGVMFAGCIDLVSMIANEVCITDFKTCQSALKQTDADSSTQLTMYSYLYMLKHRQMANQVGLAYFTKHTRDNTQSGLLKSVRRFSNYVNLYENLFTLGMEVSESVDNDHFPKKGILKDCKDTYNQMCVYHPMCFPEQYSKNDLAVFESHLKETCSEEL